MFPSLLECIVSSNGQYDTKTYDLTTMKIEFTIMQDMI